MENSFGDRLKMLRLKLGLTQREIAQRIGLSPAAYFKYETGKAQPKLDVIVKLKNIFNVNIEWLCDGTGNMFKNYELSEKILNDNNMLAFIEAIDRDTVLYFSALAFFEEYKRKHPAAYSDKSREAGDTKK